MQKQKTKTIVTTLPILLKGRNSSTENGFILQIEVYYIY